MPEHKEKEKKEKLISCPMSLASFFLGIACSADIRLFLNADKCCDEEGNVQKDINNT